MPTYLFTFVFPDGNTSHYLLVDKVCCYRVISWVLPRQKVFLPEVQSPGGAAFAHAALLRVLLTLCYSIHDAMCTVTQTRNLSPKTCHR